MTQLRSLTAREFAFLAHRLPRLTRNVNAVHLHGTGWLDHAEFRGRPTLEGLLAFYRGRGLTDLPQHVTVDPQGGVWVSRSWNAPPCSVAGSNGSPSNGPLMVAVVGDFSPGRDRLEGAQWDALIHVLTALAHRFGLGTHRIQLHSEFADAPCLEGALSRERLDEALQGTLAAPPLDLLGGEDVPFGHQHLEVAGLAAELAAPPERLDPPDAEAVELPTSAAELDGARGFSTGGTRGVRGSDDLGPAVLERLRPHVINLNQGGFTSGGLYHTEVGDVDAIVDRHLPQALLEAQARQEPLRIVLYAHGGLVDEKSGLRMARDQQFWWKRNGVYPLFFVWETGLFESIGQIFDRIRSGRRGARDLFDYTTDPMVEGAVRFFGGKRIWRTMKESAVRASVKSEALDLEGAAWYVAGRLARFVQLHPGQVELHAVGHSAGAIFHAHFLPRLIEEGAQVQTLHFMAPALRVDEFKSRIGPRLGQGIGPLTLYTMRRSYERDDDCAGLYRKSLLYLIHHALEAAPEEPILGLEDSLLRDRRVAELLGLTGSPSAPGEVVWSPEDHGPRSASGATSHGGFDNDPPTMESILRRILDRDAIELPFPEAGTRELSWRVALEDLPEELALFLGGSAATPAAPVPAPAPAHLPPSSAAATGRRRALCVGIDAYAGVPLSGCVADARLWARTFQELGFQVDTTLEDASATRDGILQALDRLVSSSRPGDVLAFHYSGHGTNVPDVDGDEADAKDEALCPYDCDQGFLVLDDDLAGVFAGLPAGVSLTCFIDCCHSGEITRLLIGGRSRRPAGARPRYRLLGQPALEAHLRFREAFGARGRGVRSAEMREVLFSACQSHEVAYESEGHGHFTLRATELLLRSEAVTNEEFHRRVVAAFGPSAAQNPRLDCSAANRGARLLQAAGALGLGAFAPSRRYS